MDYCIFLQITGMFSSPFFLNYEGSVIPIRETWLVVHLTINSNKMNQLMPEISLRNQVFAHNWEQAFDTAAGLLLQHKEYHYFDTVEELLILLHLLASKGNRYKEWQQLMHKALTENDYNETFQCELMAWQQIAENKTSFSERVSIKHYESAPSLETLHAMIEWRYTHLLNNENEKRAWLLTQLFEGGKAPEFIQLYESNRSTLIADYHLKAAIIYIIWKETDNAKQALNTYFELAFNTRPLAPFLYPELLEVMDKEFSNSMLQKFKQ